MSGTPPLRESVRFMVRWELGRLGYGARHPAPLKVAIKVRRKALARVLLSRIFQRVICGQIPLAAVARGR